MFGEKYDRDGAGGVTCPVCDGTLRRHPRGQQGRDFGLFTRSPAEKRLVARRHLRRIEAVAAGTCCCPTRRPRAG